MLQKTGKTFWVPNTHTALTRRAVNPSPGSRRRRSGSQANPAALEQTRLSAPVLSGLRSTPPTGLAVRRSCPIDDGISPRCRWLSPVLPPFVVLSRQGNEGNGGLGLAACRISAATAAVQGKLLRASAAKVTDAIRVTACSSICS